MNESRRDGIIVENEITEIPKPRRGEILIEVN
jgi:hypothetical protein